MTNAASAHVTDFEDQARRAWEAMRAKGHPITTKEAFFIAAIGNQIAAEIDGREKTASVWSKVAGFVAENL